MAVLLSADGSQRTVFPQSPPCFALEELQGLVGGLIELMPLEDGGWLIINEEGKLQPLPYNKQASLYAHESLWPGDSIVGSAVLVSEHELSK